MPLNKKPEQVILSMSDWEEIQKDYETIQFVNETMKTELMRKNKILDAIKRAGVIIDPSVLHDGPLKMVVEKSDDGDVSRVVVKADV